MKDREFLIWLHQRLEHVHHENPCVDYMHMLRKIIRDTSPVSDSSSMLSRNSLYELKKDMGIE
jgi:hypothetical protein